MVRINWTFESKKDLKQIKMYISLDSCFYAKLTISKIVEKVNVLYDYPYIGRIIPELNNEIFRELFYKNYRIMYKIVSKNQVDILTVYHSARNLDVTILK